MFRLPYLIVFTTCILCEIAAGRANLQSVAEIRGDLSPVLDEAYRVLDTDHFSVIFRPGSTDGDKIAHLLEMAYGHFQSLFDDYDFKLQTPQEKLSWVAFSDNRGFSLYTIKTEGRDLSWLTGYYSASTNLVAVVAPEKISKWRFQADNDRFPNIIACPPDAETDLVKIVHEAAHQLSFNTGLQKRRVMYPLWASEGLAMFFEKSLLSEHFRSCRYTSLRSRRLVSLSRRKKLIPLEEFVSMSRVAERESAIDVYAQAWGVFQFLFEDRPESLREYFSSLYELKPGWRSEKTLHGEFVKAFGPLDLLNHKWRTFLQNLPSRY